VAGPVRVEELAAQIHLQTSMWRGRLPMHFQTAGFLS
jgi:hypothetical protein